MKMPEEKIDSMLFAPCGMNCLVCYKRCFGAEYKRYMGEVRRYL